MAMIYNLDFLARVPDCNRLEIVETIKIELDDPREAINEALALFGKRGAGSNSAIAAHSVRIRENGGLILWEHPSLWSGRYEVLDK